MATVRPTSVVQVIQTHSNADSLGEGEIFEVVSPVRPGGRPNQKASTKKTKKKRGVIDARHDSNMHHMQLDLSVLSKMLLEDHTLNSSEKTLRQYR
ncbi:hypothetical protein JG688_00017350, partial [Phytophthora aleatoria]